MLTDPHPTGGAIPGDAPAAAESARAIRFSALLAFLLAELILSPLIGTTTTGISVDRLLGAISLAAALWAVGMRRATIAIFIVALVSQVAAHHSGVPAVLTTSYIIRLLFWTYVTGAIVRRVLRESGVTMDTIAGAACGYVLLGVIFVHLYWLLEYARPGSFDIPGSFLVGRDPIAALAYFSFVTLTTVGYGDIHPTEAAAGGLCAAEALIGQLYLAIMIARLVGVHAARRAT